MSENVKVKLWTCLLLGFVGVRPLWLDSIELDVSLACVASEDSEFLLVET